jgi:hypothetical protein
VILPDLDLDLDLDPCSEKVKSDKVIADEELKGLLGKKLRDDKKKKKKKGGDAVTTAQ